MGRALSRAARFRSRSRAVGMDLRQTRGSFFRGVRLFRRLSGSGFSRSGLRGGLLLRRFLRETQVAQARHPLIALALRLFLLLDDLVVFLVAGGEVLLGPRLVRLPKDGLLSFLDTDRKSTRQNT